MGFSFITHQPKKLDYRVIYQSKARIILDLLTIGNNIFIVNENNCEIKTIFFTFIFLCEHILLNTQAPAIQFYRQVVNILI